MSASNAIHCYQYVTAPYEVVRDVLCADALGVFQRATVSASSRAKAVVTGLHARVAGLDIGADASVEVTGIVELPAVAGIHGPCTTVKLTWRAAKAASFFPRMTAELSVYALSANETQVDFVGDYEPPFGIVGDALDAIAGRRIAQATVHRFVEDVAMRLREETPARTRMAR